jgi:hypothetical protein
MGAGVDGTGELFMNEIEIKRYETVLFTNPCIMSYEYRM